MGKQKPFRKSPLRRSGKTPPSKAKSPKTDSQTKAELTLDQRKFLAAFSEAANITLAAEIARVNRTTHYHWLREPTYRMAFLQAREAALDRLELEAWNRAKAGSDRLLIFLLSSYRARFRVDTQPAGPIFHEMTLMDDETLQAEAGRELRQLGYDNLEQLWTQTPHE